MIVIVRKATDNTEQIIQQQESIGNMLYSVKNKDDTVTMEFIEASENRLLTLEEAGGELRQAKEELNSTQLALSELYEEFVIMQQELTLLKEEKNNG